LKKSILLGKSADLACYGRVTISEEAKFLTVWLATFHDNKQKLYPFFRMFLQLPIHCKTTSLSLKIILQNCYTTG